MEIEMISREYTTAVGACLSVWVPSVRSHDFIGEFTTSYRELSRGQNQFNVYEVRHNTGVGLCSFFLFFFVVFSSG